MGRSSALKARRRVDREKQRDLQLREFWHGGIPGLKAGDRLLCFDDLDNDLRGAGAPHMTSRTGSLPDPTRSDRVYFASDREFARAFAKFMAVSAPSATRPRRGALYRVEPIGEIHVDPDFRGRGVSWCARSAVILECEELEVVMSESEANAAVGPHMTWDDGSAMYAENGIVLRSREMRTAGVPALALTRYGRWPYIEKVLQDLNARIAHGEFTTGR